MVMYRTGPTLGVFVFELAFEFEHTVDILNTVNNDFA